MARKKGERGSRKSLKQQYDFLKVKGAEVVTDFNHDPAKNANSTILKIGGGDTSEHPEGKVQGGYLYYLCEGVWRKTDYTSNPQPSQAGTPCAGENSADFLLGIALGSFGEYEGTPQEIGMLINGVTTVSLYTVGAAGGVGKPIYVTADNGVGATYDINISGTMTPVAPATAGNIIRPVAYTLANQLNTTLASNRYRYESLILFKPAPISALHGAAAGSKLYQDL